MSQKRKIQKSNKIFIVFIFIIGFFIGVSFTNLFILRGERATTINIVYSSEKASWMTIAYSDFMEQWQNDHPDQKIVINMHPYGSSDSIISILNGEIFPTIWSPASSVWIPFLNTKWIDYTGASDPLVSLENTTRIIYSPIVIATWESFNQSYGINGFLDIYNLIKNQSVDIKMAHTDPRLSNSGFMSTIMAISASSGVNSENLTMTELMDPDNQKWLTHFESSAIMYGKSTGFLARYMKGEGPSSLNIAFLYENLIRDISNKAEAGKIIAIYPEEGTLYSDHPFCILNGDWITPEQRLIAEEFLTFLNQKETIISAMEYGFRLINSSISLDPEIFNYENYGISYNISVPELKTPDDGRTLLKIPDMWLLCKANA